MRYAIGMDVGGTSARAALVSESGEIVASASRPTGFDTPRDELLARFQQLLREVREAASEHKIEGVGIGMPGLQDERGCVDSASNLPALNGVDLRGEVARLTGVPAFMENDLNMIALGEYHFGGHAVPGNLLVVAVGTGVGAAVLQGGRLLRVFRGSLGDPGHVLVEPGGALCRCGAHGCLEAHLAGWALVEQAIAAGIGGSGLRPADLFDAARTGNPAARTLLDRAAGWLGMGLASFCALYQPERIVMGGNVLIEGADALLPAAKAKFQEIVQPWMRDMTVALSAIPQTAGVLGGAACVLRAN